MLPGSCPVSTSNNPTINSNGLRGQFLLDLGGTFNLNGNNQTVGALSGTGGTSLGVPVLSPPMTMRRGPPASASMDRMRTSSS